MPSGNEIKYEVLGPEDENPGAGSSAGAYTDLELDSGGEDFDNAEQQSLHHGRGSKTALRLLACANIVMFIVLVVTWLAMLRTDRSCQAEYRPPYSKVRDDGAVRPVTKRFKPIKVFQSEPSAEVDDAWNRTLEFDRPILLTHEFAKEHGLPRSAPLARKPEYGVYAVSAFHQLHCLNIIRESFYPERYATEQNHTEFLFHKNHCFDFLRQAIMCKSDVSMIYWWNTHFTTVEADGSTRDSDYYLSLTPEERQQHSFVQWDVEHQCQDFDLVSSWVQKNGFTGY